MSQRQLRCFMMRYLSELSVESVPRRAAIHSATRLTSQSTQSGAVMWTTKRTPSRF